MGEQGAESIHHHMMKMERDYYLSIPNELDRLKYIMTAQVLESAPSLTSLRPETRHYAKKRKLEEEESSSDEEVSEDEERD